MKQSLAYLDKIVELINLGAEINIKARLTHLKRIIEDESEQLHKPVVVRGGDSESQLVERTKRYFKYPDWIERKITPPEPLATEALDTVAEARDFRHCYIRTKIGCHCTDECGYDALMRGISDEGQP